MYPELQTFGKDIILRAEAQSELCLGGAILVVSQHWLNFIYSSVEFQQVLEPAKQAE